MNYVVFTCEKKKEFDGKKGGKYAVYTVKLRNPDGEYETAELVQKAEQVPPAEGTTLDGSLEKTDFGLKFVKAQQGGGFGGRSRSPKENAQIVHQAALKVAIQYVAAKVSLGKLEDFTPEDVNKIATAFRGYVEKVDVA